MERCEKEIFNLVENLKYIDDCEKIAQTLDSFVDSGINLRSLWKLKDLFEKLTDAEYEKYPSLKLAGLFLEICRGRLDIAGEYIKRLSNDNKNQIYADIMLPSSDLDCFLAAASEIRNGNFDTIPYLTPTVYRPYVLNGFRDFTPYAAKIEKNKEKTQEIITTLWGSNMELLYEIALAESLYQQNKLYEALVIAVSVIPQLTEEKHVGILFAALYLQIVILVMNGQLKYTGAMMKEMKAQIVDKGHSEYMPNLCALDAWAAMYDGEYERVTEWMYDGAPDEYNDFNMLDTFSYMIKMRVYIIEGNNIAVLMLAGKLLPKLIAAHRYMDTCEVYMLLALSDYTREDKKSAFENIEEALELAEKYRYDRLIADEGMLMYRLLSEYKETISKSAYLEKVTELCKETAMKYPAYLTERISELHPLTCRELEVLRLMSNNLSNASIAELMNITLDTVKFHGKNIFRKLQVENRAQAVEKAKRMGVL